MLEADLRCLRCAERHPADRPPVFGKAVLLWGDPGKCEVAVISKRRRGRKELAGRQIRLGSDDGRRMTDNSEGAATSGELSPAFYQRAMRLHCRRCRLRPHVVLEQLR